MKTKVETPNIIKERKTYSSVPEMIRDISSNKKVGEKMARRIEERQFIRLLIANREVENWSVKDVAKKLGWSKKEIVRFEKSKDDEVSFGLMRSYFKLFGINVILRNEGCC